MFDRHSARMALIILAAAGLYLIGNDRVGLWDRDEPRYAQTSKQMLQSDPPNWVVPYYIDQPRTAKPIFIYWCQAVSMWLLGQTNEFAARLPSAVAMILTLIIFGAVLHRYIGPQRATWTVLILATSGLAIAAAKMCITDAVLLLWVTIAQICLFAIYRGRMPPPRPSPGVSVEGVAGVRSHPSPWLAVVMWIAIGLAGLTKGPVVLGVQLTTMLVLLAFDVGGNWRRRHAWSQAVRWWRYTRPLLGVLILAAIVGPWLIMLERRSPGFLRQSLLHDVIGRSVKPLEGHKGPPGFYLLTVWGTFLPWCLLLPTAITIAWKHRRLPAIRFALAAIFGPWIMFELVQTKLVHYVLPTFPALAFLTADAIVRCLRRQHDDLHRPIAVLVTGIWAIAIMAIGLVPWLAVLKFRPLSPTLYSAMATISIIGIAFALSVFVMFRRSWLAGALAAMGAWMFIVGAVVYGFYLPNAEFFWLPQRIAGRLVREGATKGGDVAMIDFKEDSLKFYQGGTIREADELLNTGDARKWPKWVVITQAAWRRAPAGVKTSFELVESFNGYNYANKGRIVDVLVLKKRQ